MFPFYTPWKRQKTFGFWHFKGGGGGVKIFNIGLKWVNWMRFCSITQMPVNWFAAQIQWMDISDVAEYSETLINIS